MINKVWEMLLEWLKSKPYWKRLQPFVIWLLGFIAVEFLAYQYIQSEYGFSLKLSLFLGSYISLRIILVFSGIAVILILFQLRRKDTSNAPVSKMKAYLMAHQKLFLYRGVIFLGVLIALTAGFLHLSPRKVSNIRIIFMDYPRDYNREALAYLIYELNRLHRDWYFEIDFRLFNADSLTSIQKEECEKFSSPLLCYAELEAEGQPLIGITSQSLEPAYFCTHRGKVSVISTYDAAYEPISNYDYLMYCIIVQSILIHLDANGGGLPPKTFEESYTSHGGVFQFTPEMEAIKSTILAARFSPKEEELLFNRFGAKYIATCKDLLSLEWLHSKRVSDNLEKNFGVVRNDQ
jgi:hypothetical protein